MSRVDGTLALVCHYLNDLRAFSGDDISRLTMSDRSSRQRRICQQGGAVHSKMIRNKSSGSTAIWPVAAAQPMTGGNAPAAPPITMFCGVRRFSHIVYMTT